MKLFNSLPFYSNNYGRTSLGKLFHSLILHIWSKRIVRVFTTSVGKSKIGTTVGGSVVQKKKSIDIPKFVILMKYILK